MEKTFYYGLAILCAITIIMISGQYLGGDHSTDSTDVSTDPASDVEASLLSDVYLDAPKTTTSIWDYAKSLQDTDATDATESTLDGTPITDEDGNVIGFLFPTDESGEILTEGQTEPEETTTEKQIPDSTEQIVIDFIPPN